jgi:hypothetical protein
MQLKTILNRVEPFKFFVYGKASWVEDTGRPTLEVEVHARKNGRAICSGCGCPGSGYDRLPERQFEFVPLWGIAVYFLYAMRRVDCPSCGVQANLPVQPAEDQGCRLEDADIYFHKYFGRAILVIFNMNPGKHHDGWNQVMSLPRRLTLNKDDGIGAIRVEPVDGTDSLRSNHQRVEAMALELALHGCDLALLGILDPAVGPLEGGSTALEEDFLPLIDLAGMDAVLVTQIRDGRLVDEVPLENGDLLVWGQMLAFLGFSLGHGHSPGSGLC